MVKTSKNFDFPEGSLAVGLMFEGSDLLNGHLQLSSSTGSVSSRANRDNWVPALTYSNPTKTQLLLATYQTIP